MNTSGNISSILNKNGFSVAKKVLKQTNKKWVVIAEKDHTRYCVKIALDKEMFTRIENEVEANNFIRTTQPETLPLSIPHSSYILSSEYALGIFEYIPGTPLADHETLTMTEPLTDKILEKLYTIESFFCHIPEAELSNYFTEKKKDFSRDRYHTKMNGYIERALGKLISHDEYAQLQSIMSNVPFNIVFQYHDIAPWNMILHDEKIALIDAEYAHYGIQWFDIVYFFMQTYTVLCEPELAKHSLDFFVKKFEPTYPTIKSAIFFPLCYRITANLNEALGNPIREKLARELLVNILTGNFETIIT